MAAVVAGCKSAEEALIKRAAVFDLEGTKNWTVPNSAPNCSQLFPTVPNCSQLFPLIPYCHTVLSSRTVTPYIHPALSYRTLIPYIHTALSSHTATPYYHTALTPLSTFVPVQGNTRHRRKNATPSPPGANVNWGPLKST